ncbi:MAG: glycine--tRNA ligase subunit beta [Deltaproteobacteria bacterium]|nr:glycine--tRNA ligase subunit beta [Deltaproteobacteria bacterium]
MAKDLLIEIGTEDIPAGFIPGAMESLENSLKETIKEHGLGFKGIHAFGTPRRLGVWIEKVEEKQADKVAETIGPARKVAFDEKGNPTKVAEGFARAQGVKVNDLKVVRTEKGEYIRARKEVKGKNTQDILSGVLPEIITSLPFPKAMRWSEGDITFARPIHWILALFGNTVLPIHVGDIKSDRFTMGHRFLRPKPFRVSGAKDYLKKIKESYVIIGPDERKVSIEKGIKRVLKGMNAQIIKDDELLNEVTNLVEYPVVLRGSFDKEFLNLPKEVVINAMREHQRYFSVVDNTGNLLPYFITIANTPAKNPRVVIKGNERVLRARLNDARFYFEKDIKIPLAGRVEALKGVVFQAKLGTSYEKMDRLRALALFIADMVLPAIKRIVDRVAYICKADLVSGMVGEFPKLQGIMGREYALRSGEDHEVAKAIYEHYLPLSAGGELPTELPGAIVGIADRMDTICGCFGIGLVPTGTADPYGLRRHAIAIIAIILEKDLIIPIDTLVDSSIKLLKDKVTRSLPDIKRDVLEFFSARLQNQLLNQGYSHDTIEAVLATPWYDMGDAVNRIKALEGFKKDRDFPSLVIAFKRVSNILKGSRFEELQGVRVDQSLFEDRAEKDLFEAIEGMSPDIDRYWKEGTYEGVFKCLLSLKGPIDIFFDRVMVMAEDKRIRKNRLVLLNNVRDLYYRIADLSKMTA